MPRPRARSHPPIPDPSGTADTILRRLRAGAATVADLVGHTGLTPNGVRLQLGALEREGWVRRAGVRHAGRAGKPALVYELDPGAEPRFSAAYLPLLVALVRILRDDASAEERGTVYRRVGAELARGASPPRAGESLAARVASAADWLRGLGGVVETEGDADRAVIRGLGCPVGEAVSVDPCVCQATAEAVARVTGARVVDRCDRTGSPRCRFEIQDRPPI